MPAFDEVDDLARNITGIFFWGSVLVVVILAGWIIVMIARRRLMAPPNEGISFGFSLQQIEAMHQSGEITDEEYKALKRRKAEQSARKVQEHLASPGRRPTGRSVR